MQGLGTVSALAIQCGNHVFRFQPGRFGRRTAKYPRHQRPANIFQAQLRGDVGRNIDRVHAQRTTTYFAISHNLPHDFAGQIDRNREAQTNIAGRAALRIETRRIDADQFAAKIDQRAAGIPRVDRRIGLDKVLVAKALQTTAANRRDNARSHGLAETKWIADRHHEITDAQIFAISEGQCGQTGGLNLDHRDIGIGIRTNRLRFKRAAIAKDHGDLIGTLDHMVIGQDQAALGIHDHARAQRL